MVKEKPETKLDLAKKAFVMILYGIEPMQGENLRDYVKRGEKILKSVSEERYVEERL